MRDRGLKRRTRVDRPGTGASAPEECDPGRALIRPTVGSRSCHTDYFRAVRTSDKHGGRRDAPGGAARMGRARRARAGLCGLRDGPHGAPSRRAVLERGASADQRPTPLDHRHLRVHGRRLSHHDGDARRSNRPSPAAADRRSRVRPRVSAVCVLDERRDADRLEGAPRHRWRDDRTLDAVADPEHVPRRRSAHGRDRRLDHSVLAGRCPRAALRRRVARVLLVGFGVPARRPGDGAAPRARPARAPGVPRPRGRAARSRQRRALARRGPRGRLRAQGVRQRRLRRRADDGTARRARSWAPCSFADRPGSPSR